MTDAQARRASRPRVLVIGGGLAGAAAACALSRDFAVTLLEKRPFLGGRVYSLEDAATGCEVDNGQHVFLGAFGRFRTFASMLGLEEKLEIKPRLNLRVFAEGRKYALRSVNLPAPLHLLPAFLGMGMLTWRERLRLARAVEAIRRMSMEEIRASAGKSFAAWLDEQGQGEKERTFFWEFFLMPALNARLTDCDAAGAFFVFRHGLLASANGCRVGVMKAGQGMLGRAAAEYIQKHGGQVLTGRAAAELEVERARVLGVRDETGRRHEAEAYISALPPEVLYRLVPPSLRNIPPFVNLPKLHGAAIVGVHLWYDREVLSFDYAGFPGHPVQWIFNKNALLGPPKTGGQYLSIVLSAAAREAAMGKDALVSEMDGHIRALFPAARGARLVQSRVVKEPFATLLPAPGFEALRPSSRTGLPDFFLAGDWTQTGWPCTMEGAIRSGETAAECVRGRVGSLQTFPPLA